jgi:hypothetical protein
MLGQEVIVAKENKLVKIGPLKPAQRKPGTGKGIWMSPDFDQPLED